MIKYFEYAAVMILLFIGFLLLVWRMELLAGLRKMLVRARVAIDEKDRQTVIQRRKNLHEFEKKNTVWLRLEQQIEYSGIRRRFPNLTGGRFIVINVIVIALCIWMGILFGGFGAGALAATGMMILEFVLFEYLKANNLKAVNEELPKLLDFLGNYSLTSSELTSIFSQISVYLKQPLRGVLEECEVESRVTGDLQTALISMAEKIEHPQFKQLIANLEVTTRYSADFTALVGDSRRSMREYLSQVRDRKGMLREAAINMMLLLIMSVVVLLTVNMLIGGGIAGILFGTFVGHLALGAVGVILGLFAVQVFSMNK